MLRKEDFEHIGTLGRAHGTQGEVSAKLSVDLSGLWEGADTSLFLMLGSKVCSSPIAYLSVAPKGRISTSSPSLVSRRRTKQTPSRDIPVWLDRDYLSGEEDVEDFFDLQHFVGFDLYDASTQSCVGRAVEIDESTINTLLRVETTAGEELILPISEELIERLDLQGHRLYLHIPAGLLEL